MNHYEARPWEDCRVLEVLHAPNRPTLSTRLTYHIYRQLVGVVILETKSSSSDHNSN